MDRAAERNCRRGSLTDEYLRPQCRQSSNQEKTMKKILSVIMGVLLFAGAFTPRDIKCGRGSYRNR